MLGRPCCTRSTSCWCNLNQPELCAAAHHDLLSVRVDAVGNPALSVLSHSPERSPVTIHHGSTMEDAIISLCCVIRGTVVVDLILTRPRNSSSPRRQPCMPTYWATARTSSVCGTTVEAPPRDPGTQQESGTPRRGCADHRRQHRDP